MKANNNGSYPTSFWFFVTFGAGHVLKLVSLLPSKVMLALLNISDPKGQFIVHASCADGRTNERSFSSATLSGGQLIGYRCGFGGYPHFLIMLWVFPISVNSGRSI